MGMQQ